MYPLYQLRREKLYIIPSETLNKFISTFFLFPTLPKGNDYGPLMVGRVMVTQRCPHSNPLDLWRMLYDMTKEITFSDELKLLIRWSENREPISNYSSELNVIIKVVKGGRERQSRVRGWHDYERMIRNATLLFFKMEKGCSRWSKECGWH